MSEKLISIVVPIYNEQETIGALEKRLTETLSKLKDNWEVILVNDGSKDQSLLMLKSLCAVNPKFKFLSFSRNFGHQTAITAGMDFAKGDAVVVIDADLQDPPELILEMCELWKSGFDVVYAVRKKRKGESVFKLATAKIFYRIMKNMTNIDIPLDTGDFRLLDRKVVNVLKSMPERHRYVRGLVSWVGFKQTGLEYDRDARFAGETKYPLKKMLKFAADGLTSFSVKPLQFATVIGFWVSFIAFLGILWVLYIRFFTTQSVIGWSSLMVAVLFLGGIQLLTIGIIGEYLGRLSEEVKQRPLYIIADKSEDVPK